MIISELPIEILSCIFEYVDYKQSHIKSSDVACVCKDFFDAYVYKIEYGQTILNLVGDDELTSKFSQCNMQNYKYCKTIKHNLHKYLTQSIPINSKILTALFSSTHKINMCTSDMNKVLPCVKNTRITHLKISGIYSDKCRDVYIPPNITNLDVSDCTDNIIFESRSNIKSIILKKCNFKNNIALPNTIEHIRSSCGNVNFVDCNFDNCKTMILDMHDDRLLKEWEQIAMCKATEYVHFIDVGCYNVKNNIVINNINARKLDTKHGSVIPPKNVEDLFILPTIVSFSDYTSILDIGEFMTTLNSYKFLKHLDILFYYGHYNLEQPLNIDRLTKLSIKSAEQEWNNITNLDIRCKNLTHLTLEGCDIVNIHTDNIKTLKMNSCNIPTFNFPNVETIELFYCWIICDENVYLNNLRTIKCWNGVHVISNMLVGGIDDINNMYNVINENRMEEMYNNAYGDYNDLDSVDSDNLRDNAMFNRDTKDKYNIENYISNKEYNDNTNSTNDSVIGFNNKRTTIHIPNNIDCKCIIDNITGMKFVINKE